MKKIFMLLATFVIAIARIDAANVITVQNAQIPQGRTGLITVELTNDKAYTAFQMKLTLPEGLEMTGVQKGSRMLESHSLSFMNNTGMITCLSTSNESFSGSTGALFTITVQAASELRMDSVLEATLTEIKISTSDVEEDFDPVTFPIIITDSRVVLDENSTNVPEDAKNVNVRVKRTINGGCWNTICLPFDMTEAKVKEAFGSDVELADFSAWEYNSETSYLKLTFTEGITAIYKNHPYLIKTTKNIEEFTVDDVDIDVSKNKDEVYREPFKEVDKGRNEGYFCATYITKTLGTNLLFLNGGKLYYTAGETEIKAYRGWFDLEGVNFTNGSRMALVIGDDTSSITTVLLPSQEEEMNYNLNGQRVTSSTKGIIVKGGKKTIVK